MSELSTHMKRERVQYREDEKRKIIDTAFVLRQRSPLMTMLEAWDATMQYMPPERRREVKYASVLPSWFKDGLNERRERLRKGSLGKLYSLVPVQQEPESQKKLIEKAAQYSPENSTLRELYVIRKQLSDLLGEQRRTNKLLERIIHIWEDEAVPVEEVVSAVEAVGDKETAVIPHVVILGALDKQIALLREEFPQLSIRGTKLPHEVEPLIKYATHVLLWTSFSSHALHDLVKANRRNDQEYVYVSGGLSALRTELARIVDEKVKA